MRKTKKMIIDERPEWCPLGERVISVDVIGKPKTSYAKKHPIKITGLGFTAFQGFSITEAEFLIKDLQSAVASLKFLKLKGVK